MLEIADTRRRLLPYKLTVAEAASAAALDGVVDVVVVAEGEGALHEEEDGERVQRRDERDGQRVAAALTAGADTVAAHDTVRPRRDLGVRPRRRRPEDHVRVGRHLGMQTAPPTRARRVSDATNRKLQCLQFKSSLYLFRDIPYTNGLVCTMQALKHVGQLSYINETNLVDQHVPRTYVHILLTRAFGSRFGAKKLSSQSE